MRARVQSPMELWDAYMAAVEAAGVTSAREGAAFREWQGAHAEHRAALAAVDRAWHAWDTAPTGDTGTGDSGD